MGTEVTVLVPLYIYPLSDQTWKPLYDAITAHPDIDFLVIVNPNSGPGDAALPGHDYEREIPKLNGYANVVTVGYVRINYCKRALKEVYDEVETYAGWASIGEGSPLGMKGIFLDETPNHFSPERANYLDAVRDRIKATKGILGERLVIHNPGTPPDGGLADPGPDIIVTCEEPYERYRGKVVQQRLRDYHFDPPRSGYLISGVPKWEVRRFVGQLRRRGHFLFVTDLVDNFYESFGDSWSDFVAAMG